MSDTVWIVEWYKFTTEEGDDVWSSMTFGNERKANTFATIIGHTQSDFVVVLEAQKNDYSELIVNSSPKHASIFALVTWNDDSKTIHWDVPNDVVALWLALDEFGDPRNAKRVQVCESDSDDIDMSQIASDLIDFEFNHDFSGECDE
jgi:hypothetical protein